MKKYLISILLSIVIVLTANIVYGANENLKEVKYYNNLIKNENIVTILLNKNTKTRKTTKKEVMNFDKNITKIKDSKGNELKETDVVKTSDYIKINKIDYKVVLYGDVNKDGYVCDIEDIMIIENNYLGKRNVSQIEKLAGNLQNNDDTLDIEDIMKMANTYLGTLKTDIISKVPSGNIIIKTDDNKKNTSEDKKDNTDDNKKDDTDNKKEETGTTPVAVHGSLSVKGTEIVDKNGNKFQLKGVSTHGLQWFPQYVNQESFTYMRDNWGINAVRLAMYSDPNVGYTQDLHKVVDNGVKYATNSGLYVIIDWHILSDGNPNTNKSSAIKFFKEMAEKYKDNNNVIYEICNEPNGDVQWERDIKPYAQDVIKEIRKIDSDAIIVVGTPTWSQDVDVVAQSPIKGYNNIMYALHFYAATHKDYLRQKLTVALKSGLPIFVTEFGITDASGNGAVDVTEANTWIDFLNKNNISWMCWNLSNKDESSSLLKNTNKLTNWTKDELSDEGKWLLDALKR